MNGFAHDKYEAEILEKQIKKKLKPEDEFPKIKQKDSMHFRMISGQPIIDYNEVVKEGQPVRLPYDINPLADVEEKKVPHVINGSSPLHDRRNLKNKVQVINEVNEVEEKKSISS